MLRLKLALALLGISTFLLLPEESRAQDTASPSSDAGCPLELAVQQVDQFIDNRFAEMARTVEPLLKELNTINEKAKKPGIVVGRQLSADDRERFNKIRHFLVQADAERVEYSKFLRDVHVMAETLQVAKLADIYELKKEDINDASPRMFYFIVLESIRIAQPKPLKSKLIDSGISCDPEAGLFFEETFNQRELAQGSMNNQNLVNLIDDIEQLRTFYQLVWLRFNKGISDIRAITWDGDSANGPDTLSEAVSASSNSMQQMWRAIVPYIDKVLPSDKEVEITYNQRFKSTLEKEYPAK